DLFFSGQRPGAGQKAAPAAQRHCAGARAGLQPPASDDRRERQRGAVQVTIRVLVVDDSRLVREILIDIINSHPDMRVVGTAEDPYQARELIDELRPDVLTLDVEMPRMSGLQFLEKLMRAHPMPVVMISAHTEQGSEVTLRALELGAVDFVPKPRL